MTLTVILVVFLQIVLTWLISPLLAGVVSALRMRDLHWILQPYRDLLQSLSSVDYSSMLSWSLTMVLVLLIPVISLRAPLDWMSEVIFMWTVLALAQVVVVSHTKRVLVGVLSMSSIFLLMMAIFGAGSFHSTIILSNGLSLKPLGQGIAVFLVMILVMLSSRLSLTKHGCEKCLSKGEPSLEHSHTGDPVQFSVGQWSLWTNVWLLVLWGSAIIFPQTLALNWTPLALLIAGAYFLGKFLLTSVVLLLASWIHEKISFKAILVFAVLYVFLNVGLFAYTVLA